MEGGTLKTMALMNINGQRRWAETLIYFDKILHVTEYPFEDYPYTCLIQYTDASALHVDVSLKQMRKILDEHKHNPMKNFDTHCNMSETPGVSLHKKEKSKIS